MSAPTVKQRPGLNLLLGKYFCERRYSNKPPSLFCMNQHIVDVGSEAGQEQQRSRGNLGHFNSAITRKNRALKVVRVAVSTTTP